MRSITIPMLVFFISVFALLFSAGCTENNFVLPYTTSQLVNQSTDLNYTLFKEGYYDGNFLVIDNNKLSVYDLNLYDYNVPWEQLINFPSGCGVNQAVKIVGSSLVCVDLPTDENYVPYQGATADVNLGTHDLNANEFFGDGESLIMKNASYLEVADFGWTQINGQYFQTGSLNGKPRYFFGTNEIFWDVTAWKIMWGGSTTMYVSSQDVATPDLITSWDVYIAVPPAGTITASIAQQTVEDAYVAKRTTLDNTDSFALLIDGTANPFDSILSYSTMQGIRMDRKRLGFNDVNVGGSASAYYYNKGIYNKISQEGTSSFTVKPQTFGSTSVGWENELYSTLNPSGQTQFGSTETLFGMSNIISKTGTWQTTDDFGIGSTLRAYGLYNSVVVSPNVAEQKTTVESYGIYNSSAGSVIVGVTPALTMRFYGIFNYAGGSHGSASPGAVVERYASYNVASQQFGTSYGSYNSAESQFATNYGVYAKAINGTTNWAFYNAAGNNFLGLDNAVTYVGTSVDAGFSYNGTDFLINPRYVGSGITKLQYGARVTGATLGTEKLNNGTFTGNANYWVLGTGFRYNTNLVRKDLAGVGTLVQPDSNMVSSLVKGEWMTLTFTISSRTAGGVTPSCGGFTGTKRSANGTYTETFRVTDPTLPLTFTPDATTSRFYIDTISLKAMTDGDLEVDGDLNVYKTTNLLGDVTAENDLNVLKNLTVDGNVFYKMPHLFGIADTNQAPLAINTWKAIDFNFLKGDSYGFSASDSNGIIVSNTGHYFASFEVQFQDNSPSPLADVAVRITKNGVEVEGSYSEVDTVRQDASQEITTFAYIEAIAGDVLQLQWITSDIDVNISSSNTFTSSPVVAKGFINWVHPDGM